MKIESVKSRHMESKDILDRRKRFVPNAIGIFNPSTAVSAKGAVITDADGREMIDFAGGIGVVNAGHNAKSQRQPLPAGGSRPSALIPHTIDP